MSFGSFYLHFVCLLYFFSLWFFGSFLSILNSYLLYVFFSICSLLLLSLADTTFWLFVFSCMSFPLFYLLSLFGLSCPLCPFLYVCLFMSVFFFFYSKLLFLFSVSVQSDAWSTFPVCLSLNLFTFCLSVCLYLQCLHRFVCFFSLIYFLSVYLSCLLHNFCLFVFLYLYGLMRGSFFRFVCLSTEAQPTNPT